MNLMISILLFGTAVPSRRNGMGTVSIGGKTFKSVVIGEQFGVSVNWVIVCIPFAIAAVAVQPIQSLGLSTSCGI